MRQPEEIGDYLKTLEPAEWPQAQAVLQQFVHDGNGTEASAWSDLAAVWRNGVRGVVAHNSLKVSRALVQIRALAWWLELESTIAYCDDQELRRSFSAPMLALIGRGLGYPPPEFSAFQAMAQGRPCSVFCHAGCV